MRMKNSGGGGERVQELQGGHMVRSTGQKDRHSKVFTAKGPRDRRVRLSAHTAIEFYDVQDRLGYDRPSKAVDWLMNKAKNAIDKLAEVPPPNPIDAAAAGGGGSSDMTILGHQTESSSGYAFQGKNQLGENPGGNSSFETQSMGTPMNFQEYPHGYMARTRVQTQDLCLSLHPSTDPTLFHGLAPATFGKNYPVPPWDGGGTGENREGYMYSSRPFLGQSSMVSQSGTLQSSFSPPVDGWNHHQIQQSASISGGLFSSQSLLQFQIPQQSHGSNEPSSASTNSYH